MSSRAELAGSLVTTPPGSANGSGGSQAYQFREVGFYAYDDRQPFNVTAAQGNVTVAIAPITSVKVLHARADSPIKLLLTHADGSDQIVPLDRQVSIVCPNKPITAIKIAGTGTGVLAFAGD